MARGVGADVALDGTAEAAEAWRDRIDVAIEAAGHPAALALCLQLVRRGGTVVQVGTLPPELSFPANAVMTRELNYLGAFRADLEFDWAVQAIRSRRADVRSLISAQLPLSRSREAFELALDRSRSTKVQLVADEA
jgi:L-idonate 5-dehydrogenase